MHPDTILAVFGALGGLVVFLGAIAGLARGIFKLIGATEANTRAVSKLTTKLDDHETRLSRLEGVRG